MLPALVTAGAAVVLLVVVLLAAMRPVRRFARARSALLAELGAGMAALRTTAGSRRSPGR